MKPTLDTLRQLAALAGCALFLDDEEGYLSWIAKHSNGYALNLDKRLSRKNYPMLHRVADRQISGERENYTTGDYFKICGTNEDALEDWAKRSGFNLTRCKKCFKPEQP
ncbi:MAG TPA: hypothetical protein PLU47_13565 [Azonexus sp.]|nr:hypothetical protein [Azonexus sp.]